jgi:thiol-disulfide isomerase/thioredoxin
MAARLPTSECRFIPPFKGGIKRTHHLIDIVSKNKNGFCRSYFWRMSVTVDAKKKETLIGRMPTVINTLLGRKSRRGKKASKSKLASLKRSQTVITPKTSTIPTASPKGSATANDNLDVRAPGQVSKLLDLIKKNKIVVVLVYADWCGHCQHYKKDTWSKVQNLPNRKVPIAQVNADVLDSTPLKSAKIEGYPSVIAVGNDGKMAGFQNEAGEPTNAIPNHSDMSMLKRMLTADPSKVLAASGATPEPSAEPEPTSKTPTPSAESAMNDAGELSVSALASSKNNSKKLATAVSANPPNVEDDLVGTGEPTMGSAQPMGSPTPVMGSPAPMNSGMPLNSKGSVPTSGPNTLSGGSLLAAMWDAAGRVAPAALLAGTAVAISSRRKTVKRAARLARRRRARRKAAAAAGMPPTTRKN